MKRVLCFALLCLSLSVQADTIKALTIATLPALESRFSGQRHAVFYWALSCLPCRHELLALADSRSSVRTISLVNTEDTQADIVAFFQDHASLKNLDLWYFADAIPERLRQAIDGTWYGELPRTYLIDQQGKKMARSGKTDIAPLLKWLAESPATSH